MAYLNFSELQGSPVAAPADVMAAAGLSALEWSVVALAQKDRLSSLKTPGRMSMAMGVIFGKQSANPQLADPRLEALRRMSVLARACLQRPHLCLSQPRHRIRRAGR
ncbi:hypothetical protein [Sphingomonas sp. S2-65]|uniref:hypothetical protein n=1 Tax=Sphingomonas sp. S2-65 TaxID=2903960 RepID=UPI001F47E7AF|nr:hypothetical protein [Sphingomonas sp. S2-65]UYY59265.1 hypothetical protein LZ586_04015 [Sphingomonas sp. S2-65]